MQGPPQGPCSFFKVTQFTAHIRAYLEPTPVPIQVETTYMSKGARGVRYAEIEREHYGVRVNVVLDFDGGTRRDVSTGIPLLDELLKLMAYYGRFDLGIVVENDGSKHRVIEAIADALGTAFRDALTETEPCNRVGDALVPAEGSLVQVALDFCGQGHAYLDLGMKDSEIGGLSTQNCTHFLNRMAVGGGIALHVRKLSGELDRQICEATFRGIGLALHRATHRMEHAGGNRSEYR